MGIRKPVLWRAREPIFWLRWHERETRHLKEGRKVPEEASDMSVLRQQALHRLKPLSRRIWLARREPPVREGPDAAAALPKECDGFIGAQQRRGSHATAFKQLELLAPQ
jgi:hypothetical protein|eukprot:180654-Prymnesium_polylepis.1